MLENNEEHPGQLKFNFEEEEVSRFERDYLKLGREEIGKFQVTSYMRKEFYESEGWMADDKTVYEWWNTYGIEFKEPSTIPNYTTTIRTNDLPVEEEPEKKQVGGNHYKDMTITPNVYITANDIDWCEGNVIKYISRHGAKNGREDVEKALHYCELILKGYDEAERLHSLTN